MKKLFEEAAIDVVTFEAEDVVTTSTEMDFFLTRSMSLKEKKVYYAERDGKALE